MFHFALLSGGTFRQCVSAPACKINAGCSSAILMLPSAVKSMRIIPGFSRQVDWSSLPKQVQYQYPSGPTK